MTPKQALALEQVRAQIADMLVDIHDYLAIVGIPMQLLSLIARDPSDDEMFILVTNESNDGFEKASGLALQRVRAGREVLMSAPDT